MDLVLFSIWDTTLSVFVGPFLKVLPQSGRFLWRPILLYHMQTGILSFVCVTSGKYLTYSIRVSYELRTENWGNPALWLLLSDKEPFTLTWIIRPTGESEIQRVSLKILYLSQLCQTLLKTFLSTSRKAATICSPWLKLSITDWESPKRWSSVDLAYLKPDWYLFLKAIPSI